MRLYHGATSPDAIRKCRIAAPSHVHGTCWNPTKMTPHEWPYFIDNGAYSGGFDPQEWLDLLDTIDEKMPHPPDFVVLPDELNDAERTIELHREYAQEVLDRAMRPAYVMQPGMAVRTQVQLADRLGVDTLFLGGACRWQRAHGQEIVKEAHRHGIRAHIGNPGSKDALLWSFKAGFDSADTSSIVRNDNYDWLEALEGLNSPPLIKDVRQSTLIPTVEQ